MINFFRKKYRVFVFFCAMFLLSFTISSQFLVKKGYAAGGAGGGVSLDNPITLPTVIAFILIALKGSHIKPVDSNFINTITKDPLHVKELGKTLEGIKTDANGAIDVGRDTIAKVRDLYNFYISDSVDIKRFNGNMLVTSFINYNNCTAYDGYVFSVSAGESFASYYDPNKITPNRAYLVDGKITVKLSRDDGWVLDWNFVGVDGSKIQSCSAWFRPDNFTGTNGEYFSIIAKPVYLPKNETVIMPGLGDRTLQDGEGITFNPRKTLGRDLDKDYDIPKAGTIFPSIPDALSKPDIKVGDLVGVKEKTIDVPIDKPIDKPVDKPIDTPLGWLDTLWEWLKKIWEAILNIPKAILGFFVVDWAVVMAHADYMPIIKEKFKPFYDISDLLQNIKANPESHNGKFYMVIPREMGGDNQEHCVLDLGFGGVYITLARNIIKYAMWVGFMFFVIKVFKPRFNIGG